MVCGPCKEPHIHQSIYKEAIVNIMREAGTDMSSFIAGEAKAGATLNDQTS